MHKDLTLSSGVQVRITTVPAMAIYALDKMLPVPKPPIIRNEEKQRDEPNDLDPAYIEAVEKRKSDIGTLTSQAYLANGILKVLSIPEDKQELDSDEWVESLEFLGLEIRRTGLGRKVDWLQYHILGDADIPELIMEIAQLGGLVTENAVEAAADSFRPNQNGPVLVEVQAEDSVRLRDTPADHDAWSSN